ncbi:MAG: response regulator [Lacipirellulaceae bacterium]
MKTVLVVDDDEVFHYLCERVFAKTRCDYELLSAFDGVEALEVLEKAETPPDVILLDINMPRMNGHEFLKEYSKFCPSEIPVVAMLTSSDQKEDRVNAMSYQFVKDYLLKPIREEDIERLKVAYDDLQAMRFEGEQCAI